MERILLINPNQYRHPPVIPIGLEYLSHALREKGFEADVVDLTFENDVYPVIEQRIATFDPHCIGVTVRNIDPALYKNNEFFLPFIRDLIRHIRTLTDACPSSPEAPPLSPILTASWISSAPISPSWVPPRRRCRSCLIIIWM
ncbi:MAG: cobalamin-dependent protein [Desulfobacterales bacterium]|nr:cobalamin-dependent protein [Desulfobacterales bacterium]